MVISAAPARMFGLAGRKGGAVAPGADADLVVYDPARKHTAESGRRESPAWPDDDVPCDGHLIGDPATGTRL